MPTYTEYTEGLADQWVSGIEQLQQAHVAALTQQSRDAVATPEIDLALAEQRQAVEANYRLADRLLTAQRDFWLGLIEASAPSSRS